MSKKKLKNLYLRRGEHPFVLSTLFAFTARKQGWTVEEVNEVFVEARKYDYTYFYKTLVSYLHNEG